MRKLITILFLLVAIVANAQTVGANKVQAGPTSGAAAPAKYRLLIAADIPVGDNYNWTGTHTFNTLGAFEVVTAAGFSVEAVSDVSFASGGEMSFDGTTDIKFFDNAHYNSNYSGVGESDGWLTSKAYVDAHSSTVTPSALTRVNDTNLIATLGGTPNTALLQAVSITLSWSGTLAAARLNSSVVQGVTNDTNVTGSISAQNLTLGWTGTLAAARLNANVVQAITNETNITGSIAAQTLTFAWSGTLAAARLNANVVQGVTNDTNITGSIATQNLTLAWAGTLAYARLVNGAGLSVVGRSANTSGVQADIAAASDNQVLRRSGTAIGFGSIDISQSNTVGTSRLAFANLTQGSGLSVLGVTGSSTADNASIAAGSDFNILRRSGTAVAFGSIDLSQSGAVGSSILAIANGGTGAATFPGYLLASGGTATAANTFTYNTANFLTINGAFTSTANNQFHTNRTGTLTARGTASDVLTYDLLNAAMVYGAASQNLIAVALAPAYNNTGAFGTTSFTVLDLQPTVSAGTVAAMLALRTTTLANVNVAIGSATAGARLTVGGSGTTTAFGLLVANSGGTTRFTVADNGNTAITAVGASTGLAIATTWTSTANNNSAITSSGTLTARGTANDILHWTRNSVGMTTGSTGQTLRLLYNTNTFTVSNTTATIIGNDYEPTIAGAQTASQHVAYAHRSGFIQWDSDISPAQITSNQNDYNPTGWYGASIVRLTTDASRNITSVAGGIDGRLAIKANVGSFPIVLTHDDGSTGTAANRYSLANSKNITVPSGGAWMEFYDNTTARWRVLSLGVAVGTTTNDAAATGYIGEEINSPISTYTNFTTTATYQAITSITLTAGDWDISAFATYSANSATITAASNAIFVISTTSASASGATEGVNIMYVPQAALLGTSKFTDTITPYRVSISGSTTYYLNAQATFTIGNPQFVGSIRARRMR